MKSPHLSRNDFVKFAVGAVGTIIGAVVGLPAIGYLVSPALRIQKSDAWVDLGPMESYEIGKPTLYTFTRSTVNGWEKTVNSYGVYIVHKNDNDVVVFSNTCTHLSCRVTWHEDVQEYVCPCHDGRFDPSGEVINTVPPRPLDRYETKVEDGNLSIRVVEG